MYIVFIDYKPNLSSLKMQSFTADTLSFDKDRAVTLHLSDGEILKPEMRVIEKIEILHLDNEE